MSPLLQIGNAPYWKTESSTAVQEREDGSPGPSERLVGPGDPTYENPSRCDLTRHVIDSGAIWPVPEKAVVLQFEY